MAVVQGKLDAIKVAKVVGDIPQNVNFAIRSSTLSNFLEAYPSGVGRLYAEDVIVKIGGPGGTMIVST